MPIFTVDFHVHCGNERNGIPPVDFITTLEKNGINHAALIDHAEFYLETQSPWVKSFRQQAHDRGASLYSEGINGLRDLYNDLRTLRQDANIPLTLGVEILNPAQITDELLTLPEFFCNCFHLPPLSLTQKPGEAASALIAKFGKRMRSGGKPGIINHPFRDRFGPYHEMLEKGTRISPEEWVPRDEVRRMADSALEYNLFLEVNLSDLTWHTTQTMAGDLCKYTTEMLASSGAMLSLGSDSHRIPQKMLPSIENLLIESGLTPSHFEHCADTLLSTVIH